jgi:hypothetical protein
MGIEIRAQGVLSMGEQLRGSGNHLIFANHKKAYGTRGCEAAATG